MNKYLKNILIALGCFLCVIILNFLLPRLIPGDTIAYLSGSSENSLTDAEYQMYYHALHLDESLFKQFIYYLKDIVNGTLGYSYQHNETVSTLIKDRVGITLLITLPALIISNILGLCLGLRSGYHRGQKQDKILSLTHVVISTWPSFLIAFVLVIIAVALGLPYSGLHSVGVNDGGDTLLHLMLPVLTLIISITPSRFLLVRNMASKEMHQSYVKYAQERGLSERVITVKYILPNIFSPFIQMVGMGMGILIGGSVIVETIFSINGMGRLLAQAINTLDYPALQGILFVTSLIMVVMIIITDLLGLLLDPQERRYKGVHHEA